MTESSGKFRWHPAYAGRTYASVQRELEDALLLDQRTYQEALDNAEKEEFGAFTTIRDLERHWSTYDLSWAETDASALSARIVAFERARDDRQEMFSWQEWREESAPSPAEPAADDTKHDWRENLTDEQRRRLASAMAIGVMVLLALMFIVVLTLIL